MPQIRGRGGVRHAFVSIVAIAVAAVLGGARLFAAMGQWAAGAPEQVSAATGVRPHHSGEPVAPAESTIRKTLNETDDVQIMGMLDTWSATRIDAAGPDGDLIGPAVYGKAVHGAGHTVITPTGSAHSFSRCGNARAVRSVLIYLFPGLSTC